MNIACKRILFVAISGLATLTGFSQKTEVPKGWHLLNPKDSGLYGISMAQAYDFVKTKKLKSSPVIVAVIDSGIDTLHEDLRPVLWKNPKEIPGNGVDDDKNGYVDDVYGWNFLGGRDGRSVEKDTYESARVFHKFRSKFEGEVDESKLSADEKRQYAMWLRAKSEVGTVDPSSALNVRIVKGVLKDALVADSVLKTKLKVNYTGKDVEAYAAIDDAGKKSKRNILKVYRGFELDLEQPVAEVLSEVGEYVTGEETKANALDAKPTPYRADIVKDNYNDFNDKFYGNGDVMVSKAAALHGTHVSGIIGAARGNGLGMDGVADNVRIMTIRAVPDGDEHDKDIALAIRYAVDNGAKVVNMSFGKGFSPEKKWVDEAVKYAESKGVLLVHAAGNSAENIDTSWNFPTPLYDDSKRASNWITVGASAPHADIKAGGLTASFSNYGKKEVDVFAPGVKIYATVPGGNTYQNLQGTSMASPVVAGLAAFLLEYYPTLSARQVKMIIEKSSQNPSVKVKEPGVGGEVDFADISKAGGIVNAYEAIKLASTMKGERMNAKEVKSTVKPKVKG
ncbi:MAG: S8 family peptidase [Chitinophagaceae bacterium]|nr:S8 family peptidase [Chitinophagaceae bacterium]